MATCRDCFHFEVCDSGRRIGEYEIDDGVYTEGVENECLTFRSTADVVEVKHGYWKDRYGNKYDNHLYECSVCGKKALYEVDVDELGHSKIRQALTPACPYCLAKMNERKDT